METLVEKRVAVRVDASLAQSLQEIADEKYEGRVSMVMREALRRIVSESKADDAEAVKDQAA